MKKVVRVPRGRAQPPRVVPPLTMACGMLTWLMLSPHNLSKNLFWSVKVMRRNFLANYVL